MELILADLRYAFRQMMRAPGFTLIAVATLAFGIGANSALYTLADSILRRPRPGVGESSSLVWVSSTRRERSRPAGISYAVAERVRQEVPLLEGLATTRGFPVAIGTTGEPMSAEGEAVSGEYFSVLRTPFALGRGFTRDEDATEGSHPVVVLSDYAWRTWFGGDSAIVGRAITVNAHRLTVVGVTAPLFNGADIDENHLAVWVPASMLTTLLPAWRDMVEDPTSDNIRAIGRLRGAYDRPQLDLALGRLSAVIAADDSSRGAGWTMRAYDASAGVPAGGMTQILPLATLALTVTFLVLLICCANVSNLMLARALGRQREIATRLSIGASRGRVVRQLVTESVLLALLASAAGLLLAMWGTDLLFASGALPIPLDVSVDWRVFLVSALLALVSGITFGLAPALHATRGGTSEVLRKAGSGGDVRRSRLQGGLVMAQVAFSLLLLTMSGLFLRALDKAQRIDVGFDASSRVLAVSVDPGLQQYDSLRAATFADALLERTRALPGVESASITDLLPLAEWSTREIRTQAAEGAAISESARVSSSKILPGYFRTIAQPLVMGRDFSDEDVASSAPVAIVSQEFAEHHFKGVPAIGARILTRGPIDSPDAEWRTVVGVVRNATVQSLQAPAVDAMYVPFRQQRDPSNIMTLLVRARAGSAATFAGPVREIVRSLDPAIPVHRQMTMDAVRDQSTNGQRNGAVVLAIFGGLALVLAAVGLHGVLLFTVRQRTREIGIRMALGAPRRAVVSIFVRRGLRLTLIGGAAGLVLAIGATQLLRSMLFGITPNDAFTFAAVSLLFLIVAIFASWLPARRASRIDPVTAMRAE